MIRSLGTLPVDASEVAPRQETAFSFRSALVTGASGFIGGHLVERLQARGVGVRCLVRATSRTEDLALPGVELRECDLDNGDDLGRMLQDVDVVFHLAARTSALSPEQLFATNAGATERLVRACAALESPPVLVYCSSIAAGGPAPPGRVRVESDPPRPISNYGRSKRAGEQAIERWAGELPATIVRPGIVFGPRSHETRPMFQSIANFGLHFVPSFQPPKLSLIYVDDLVELLLRAADHGQRIPDPRKPSAAPGEGYYYAADREHPNYSQLGRMIGVAWGMRSPLILHTSELAGWMIGVTGEWISRWHGVAGPVNRDKIREALASSWAVSGEKATRELSFTPAASLAKRLAETAAWFRSSGWL